MKPNRMLIAKLSPAILVILACASNTVPQQATITLNPEITFQTMLGWEATMEATPREANYKKIFAKYRDPLCDLAVNDLGINRVRLEIKNGAENPVDYFTLYEEGQITRQMWRERRYEVINDNDDPFTINPDGFKFAQVDAIVEELVLPIKQRLEARGEKLYVNFNYVDFGPSAFKHKNHPEEYAEFMLAAFLHLQSKYGWTPDAIEVVLESDNAGWTGAQLGQAIAATGKRLKAHGFLPDFIAPSSVSMANAAPLFDQLIKEPGAAEYVRELSYHRYGGVSNINLQGIGNRTTGYGIQTSHLEFIGATHHELHQDLTLGRNSSWAQYTLAWPLSGGTMDDGGKYYLIDDRDPENPVVLPGWRTKFLRQYFKYIRRGAVRIQATSDNQTYEPVAFINADCKPVVVVKAAGGGTLLIQGLPPGVYGIKYTTAAQYDFDYPDATISSGQPLIAMIPEPGVITVHTKSVSCTGIADVSAANYRNAELAPESIASMFGKDLANTTIVATQRPLPVTLGGTVVKVKDALGVERLAPLFFLSPQQINYQIPPGTAPGPATVSVINKTQTIALAGVNVARVAPGLFTANITGQGVAAAVVLRVKADNSQSYEQVSQFNESQGQFVPLPIDLGPDLGDATDQVFLLLFGTGIRGYSELSAVTAKIGGIEAPVIHAQPLAEYPGLDQVTIRLPRTLAGAGVTDVLLTVDGRRSNPVSVNIK